MSPTEINFYQGLLKLKIVNQSSIPKSVINSTEFKQLLGSKILCDEKSGKGRKYFIKNLESYKQWLSRKSNIVDDAVETKFQSVGKYRDSKAVKINQASFYFLRGMEKLKIQNEEIDLGYFTNNFKAFLSPNLNFSCEKACVVENKESFLMAEKLFEGDWVFLHKYGRWGRQDFNGLLVDQLMVFSDYDLVGLNEYLEIKEANATAQLYVPDNFEDLFDKYSKGTDKLLGQIMTEKVKVSLDPSVIEIRELVIRSNRFLEQEALFI